MNDTESAPSESGMRFPFLRPVPVAGMASLAGDELEMTSLEAIQMWMSHLRQRMGHDAAAFPDDQ